MTLAQLNALSFDDAVATLLQCCAVRSWAEAMSDARPFADPAALFDAADRIWSGLGVSEWREAFDGHPRIGEKKSAAAASETARVWSEREQAGAAQAGAGERSELAALQREYEARFGHIFLICASGKSSAEIIDALRNRLGNDADTELRNAAEEQQKITRLRLEKLLTS